MDPGYVAVHLAEEREHWWFRGRLAILRATLARALGGRRARLLDLGCGAGGVLAALGEFGDAVGMEANPDLLAEARARGLDARPGALPDDAVVTPGWADVVLLLDVVEHLDDDVAAFRAARRLAAAGALLLVTVPAHPWLWSAHDVTLGHRRRYTRAGLRAAVERAGWRVRHVSHFNALLLPGVAAVRAVRRLAGGGGHDLARPPAPFNALLARLFALERFVAPRWSLPCGASLLLLAHAPEPGGAPRAGLTR